MLSCTFFMCAFLKVEKSQTFKMQYYVCSAANALSHSDVIGVPSRYSS